MLYAIEEVGIKDKGDRQGAVKFPGYVLCGRRSLSVTNLLVEPAPVVSIMVAKHPSAVTVRKVRK